jgi:hypothetical protein
VINSQKRQFVSIQHCKQQSTNSQFNHLQQQTATLNQTAKNGSLFVYKIPNSLSANSLKQTATYQTANSCIYKTNSHFKKAACSH